MKLKDKIKSFPELFFQKRDGAFLVIEPDMWKWAVVGEDVKELIDFFKEERSVKDAQNYGINREIIQQLHDTGLLRINGKAKYNFNFPRKNSNKKLSCIVLHISNACNFKCAYCYTNASTGKHTALRVIKRTIELAARCNDGPIVLQFHGGEPLIHYDFIKSAVSYTNRFRRKDGSKKFHFIIQTNASLLDEKIVDFLARNKFSIGVSIDGPREFNDRMRKYGDGRGTYKDIMKGIKLLQNQKIPFGTILVVSDIKVVDHVYEFMLETDISNIRLNPYFNQGRATKKMPIQELQEEYAYKTLDLIDKLMEHNSSNNNLLRIDNVSKMIVNILGNERGYMCMRCPCGAGISMIGIDIDGSTYPCDRMIGKKELMIGNTLNRSIKEMLNSPVVKLLKNRKPEYMEDCRICEIRNACGTGCVNESYNRTGGFSEKSEMCAYYKLMFPELMWRIYSDQEKVLTLLPQYMKSQYPSECQI